jgi:hypothetical protein
LRQPVPQFHPHRYTVPLSSATHRHDPGTIHRPLEEQPAQRSRPSLICVF